MPDAGRLSQPRALDDLLLYRMARLLGLAGAPVIRLCEGRFGITRREWAVLALLADAEGMTPSALADRAQLDRARTSRAISSLVSKGLVLRSVRPGDRRHATLSLSDRGRALHAQMFPLVCGINRDLLDVLTPEAVQGLDAALALLLHRSEALAAAEVVHKADRRRGGRRRRSDGAFVGAA